jgi:hypothetical protein
MFPPDAEEPSVATVGPLPLGDKQTRAALVPGDRVLNVDVCLWIGGSGEWCGASRIPD